MRRVLYRILQTFLGAIMFIVHFKSKHYTYHGAIITEWNVKSSMSLGLFVFVTSEPFFAPKYEGQINIEERSRRLLVHEYGHTIQSLIIGPLQSTLWGFVGAKKRKDEQIPYGAFFTEGWANRLDERIIGEKSIDMLVVDSRNKFKFVGAINYKLSS